MSNIGAASITKYVNSTLPRMTDSVALDPLALYEREWILEYRLLNTAHIIRSKAHDRAINTSGILAPGRG